MPADVRWFERFGKGNAEAFDRLGWQYYVRDVFDFFYPGYFDMWPSMMGGVGMTFETDGGPELQLRKDDGTVTTFEMAIAHHYVASLATLEPRGAQPGRAAAGLLRLSRHRHGRGRNERRCAEWSSADRTTGPRGSRGAWPREEIEVTRLYRVPHGRAARHTADPGRRRNRAAEGASRGT